jgi:SAM-dependent methyltransferase
MAQRRRSRGGRTPELGAVPDRDELRELLAALAAGHVPADRELDRLYPEAVRKLSRTHWTPAHAAVRAAAWLAPHPGARVLDVGSGVGKLCIVGALTTAGEFTGIERHAPLVEVAAEVARVYAVPRVRFRAGDATAVDWSGFDGVYLYNPFAADVEIDGAEGAGVAAHADAWIERAVARLADLRPGARVAIYVGLGAPMPAGLRLEWEERIGAWPLSSWVRV